MCTGNLFGSASQTWCSSETLPCVLRRRASTAGVGWPVEVDMDNVGCDLRSVKYKTFQFLHDWYIKEDIYQPHGQLAVRPLLKVF